MADDEGGHFEQPEEHGSSATKDCPECGESFEGGFGAARLAKHRKKAHGVAPQGKPRQRSTPASTKPPTRAQELRDAEAAMFATYAMVGQVIATRDPVCGGAIMEAAPGIAKSWVELAKSNESIRRFIMGVTGPAGWMGVIIAHAPILFAFQAHHVAPALERRQREAEEAAADYEGGEAAA